MSEKSAVQQAIEKLEAGLSAATTSHDPFVTLSAKTLDAIGLLRASGDTECGCVTHDDCKGTHSTCKQSLQVDASAIVQDCYKNVRMLSRHDNFERLTHIQMTVDYLYAKGLLSREGAWRPIESAPRDGTWVLALYTHRNEITYPIAVRWDGEFWSTISRALYGAERVSLWKPIDFSPPRASQPDMMAKALDESVKLQSHYAEILNMRDGGERKIFKNSDEWVERLKSLEENK